MSPVAGLSRTSVVTDPGKEGEARSRSDQIADAADTFISDWVRPFIAAACSQCNLAGATTFRRSMREKAQDIIAEIEDPVIRGQLMDELVGAEAV